MSLLDKAKFLVIDDLIKNLGTLNITPQSQPKLEEEEDTSDWTF